MAYESPIELSFIDSMVEQIQNAKGEAITAKVSEAYGVSVNKEELEKALAYDRGQYEKGYADAMASMSNMVHEYNRLKSLECHTDSYEDGSFLFDYHEMMGVYTIGVWDGMCKPMIEDFTIESPLSHDEFVAWCNEYTMNHKEATE